jgi:hypothetical protein
MIKHEMVYVLEVVEMDWLTEDDVCQLEEFSGNGMMCISHYEEDMEHVIRIISAKLNCIDNMNDLDIKKDVIVQLYTINKNIPNQPIIKTERRVIPFNKERVKKWFLENN